MKHIAPGGKTKDVISVDWNNNGNLLGTGTLDGIVRIWDLKGKCKYTLDKHEKAIFALKWSKNGEYLLSGSVDKSVIVWDTNLGTMKQHFKSHSLSVLDIDWKNADTFASCSKDKSIFIYQIGQNDPIREFQAHEHEINAIRWSPDGRILASCSDDKTVKLWSIDQQKPLHDFTDHTKEAYTIRWCPSGPGSKNPNSNVILASASLDYTVKLWDVESAKCAHTLTKHSDEVHSISFSPCGQYIASGSVDKYIHIYSVKDGKHIKSFKGGGGIFEVCWNSTGDKLAACFTNNSICVLDFRL
jgi:transducin (beta)-like 1